MDQGITIPQHIAIIMDGNGRWAKQRGLPRSRGHIQGAQSVRNVVESCVKLGVKQLTLYCFSSENWKRPPEELSALMSLLEHFMHAERDELIRENIRLNVIGLRDGIPETTQREMDATLNATRDNTGLVLCLAINYGARREITDAASQLAQRTLKGEIRPEDITEEMFSSCLYTAGYPDPDLLIRTAGEMRLSNYLLWQLSYSEIWITQTMWPDFTEETLLQAIQDYSRRKRRFGGLVEY